MSGHPTALSLEQIQEIRNKRMGGAKICELAEEYHVVRHTIHNYLKPPYGDPIIAPSEITCVYPGIKNWLERKGWHVSDLAYAIGYAYGGMRNVLTGVQEPSKRVIDRVLAVTKLTYEEAWRREKPASDGR